ncbi:hypothetical protein JCM4814A_03650 [Streptomyces phaeofaciens JCM 4814]
MESFLAVQHEGGDGQAASKHHGGNVQIIATPEGWPICVSPVRPGREHDTTFRSRFTLRRVALAIGD